MANIFLKKIFSLGGYVNEQNCPGKLKSDGDELWFEGMFKA